MSRPLPYIEGATLDECRDLIRQGHRLEDLAAKLSVSPDDLLMLLYGHQPAWKAIPQDEPQTDLWAAEDVL